MRLVDQIMLVILKQKHAICISSSANVQKSSQLRMRIVRFGYLLIIQ